MKNGSKTCGILGRAHMVTKLALALLLVSIMVT